MINICNIGKLKIFVILKLLDFMFLQIFTQLAESYRNPFDILYSWKV